MPRQTTSVLECLCFYYVWHLLLGLKVNLLVQTGIPDRPRPKRGRKGGGEGLGGGVGGGIPIQIHLT